MGQIEFEALVAEISRAVQHTQFMLEQTQLSSFMSYFTQNDDTLTAVTKEILVPYSENGQSKQGKFAIPLATLVSHSGLTMDKVEVTIRINLITNEEHLMAELGSQDKETDDTGTENRNSCEVKLTYCNRGPSEGVSNAINMLNKTI